jgi:hypothetical protein
VAFTIRCLALFGIREQGYRLLIVLALASEVMAITMLSLFLAHRRIDRRRPALTSRPGEPTPARVTDRPRAVTTAEP